jgi:hypothetical protein
VLLLCLLTQALPVCCFPAVQYESPKSGNRVGDFMMLCAARDVHVSATLSRRFFWSGVNLFEEQLPGRSLVVLSGQDVLMAAAEVRWGRMGGRE